MTLGEIAVLGYEALVGAEQALNDGQDDAAIARALVSIAASLYLESAKPHVSARTSESA